MFFKSLCGTADLPHLQCVCHLVYKYSLHLCASSLEIHIEKLVSKNKCALKFSEIHDLDMQNTKELYLMTGKIKGALLLTK